MDIKTKFNKELAYYKASGSTDCMFDFTGDACEMSWDKCSQCATYIKHLEEEGCCTDTVWHLPESDIKRAINMYVNEYTSDEEDSKLAMCPFSMFEVPCDRTGFDSCKACAQRFHILSTAEPDDEAA